MLRKFPLFIMLMLLCLGAAGLRAADAAAGRLEALQRSHQALRADAERRTYRHHWENLIQKLEALLKAQPAPDPALEARIRYELGMAWRDLYDQSRNKRDLEPPQAAFTALVKSNPDGPLADDALYHLGEIAVKLGEPDTARRHLLRILQDYPDGNRIDEAQFLLEKIPAPAEVKQADEKAAAKPAEPAKKGDEKAAAKPAEPAKKGDEKAAAKPAEPAKKGDEKAAAKPAEPAKKGDEKTAAKPAEPAKKGEEKTAAKPAEPAKKGDEKAATETATGDITALKVWTNPDYTRLVLHLTGRTSVQHTLETPQKGESRLVIDLPGTGLTEAFEKTLKKKGDGWTSDASGGLLHALTLEPKGKEGVRVVLNVERLRDYRVTPFIEPHRLLIDLFGEVKPEEEPDDLEKLVLTLPAKQADKKGKGGKPPAWTIVIDAGHGGDDPGAQGPTGAREKDVTLAIAKKIKKKLSTLPDVRVIMTRSTDVFVPLDERTVIANKEKADLFISIHANASVNPAIHGLETYYLDTASDAAAEKLAARENASLKDRTDLAFILQDLVIEGNVRYSSRLANAVHQSMLTQTRTRYGVKKVKDHGVKTALFYVLFGAQMPCILIETAFISNPTEEARLKSEVYQNLIAEAVKAGVKRYTQETRALSRAGEK